MTVYRDLSSPESAAFWRVAAECAEAVAAMPAWKRGEPAPKRDGTRCYGEPMSPQPTTGFPNTSSVTGITYRPFTYDVLSDQLWIGSAPPPGRWLPLQGVHTVVLCAQECGPDQRPPEQYGVERVIYAPFGDSGRRPPSQDIATAERAAELVARDIERGRRCLVTCFQGRNRSGLVCALAIRKVSGWDGKRAAEFVRAHRDDALTNMYFYAYLVGKPGRRR